MSPNLVIRPNARQALLLASPAFTAIFGGAAGGGKSLGILLDAARFIHVPGYRAIVFRRTVPSLRLPGGLWEKSMEIYPKIGGLPREHPNMDWRFPSGARIVFRGLEMDSSVLGYQGPEFARIYFDELTEFTTHQFWFMMSRIRTTAIDPKTGQAVPVGLRGTCNPDATSWVRDFISPWIGEEGFAIPERAGRLLWIRRRDDGKLDYARSEKALDEGVDQPSDSRKPRPKSLTFIPSKLDDNPDLLKVDPDYADRLGLLPRVVRERMRDGNWKTQAGAGLVFDRENFKLCHAAPSPILASCRGWDRASTPPHEGNLDPDWTRGVRVHLCQGGELFIDDMVSIRDKVGAVRSLMRATAERDGPDVIQAAWQDPGLSGGEEAENIERELLGFPVQLVRASQHKLIWAFSWSPQVERGQVNLIVANYTETVLVEAHRFDGREQSGRHDDTIDAISCAVSVLGDVATKVGDAPPPSDDVRPYERSKPRDMWGAKRTRR